MSFIKVPIWQQSHFGIWFEWFNEDFVFGGLYTMLLYLHLDFENLLHVYPSFLDQYITKLFTKFNNQNTKQNALPAGLADIILVVVSHHRLEIQSTI